MCDSSDSMWLCVSLCDPVWLHVRLWWLYGVALVTRMDKIIALFCKRDLQKRRHSAKETYNFIDPTDRSHPICDSMWLCDSVCDSIFSMWLCDSICDSRKTRGTYVSLVPCCGVVDAWRGQLQKDVKTKLAKSSAQWSECCNVLHCGAMRYTVSQVLEARCSVLQCVAVCCRQYAWLQSEECLREHTHTHTHTHTHHTHTHTHTPTPLHPITHTHH